MIQVFPPWYFAATISIVLSRAWTPSVLGLLESEFWKRPVNIPWIAPESTSISRQRTSHCWTFQMFWNFLLRISGTQHLLSVCELVKRTTRGRNLSRDQSSTLSKAFSPPHLIHRTENRKDPQSCIHTICYVLKAKTFQLQFHALTWSSRSTTRPTMMHHQNRPNRGLRLNFDMPAYSSVFLPNAPDLSDGDKIILHSSILDTLTRRFPNNMPHPLIFEVKNKGWVRPACMYNI